MNYNVREHSYVVGGLGVTGQACVRYLLRHQALVKAFDTRSTFALPSDLSSAMGNSFTSAPLTPDYFDGVDTLVLSPGLSLDIEQVQLAKQCGVEVIGDVELFARINGALPPEQAKKAVGITGSNGKTTVTLLVTHLLNACGVKAIEAGNVGRPVLEAIDSDADVVVMELSSFQLETTSSLLLEAATVLNISDDHLDRHGTLHHYIDAKHRIFKHAKSAIVWRDGEYVTPSVEHESARANTVEYGLGQFQQGFSVQNAQGSDWVAFNNTLLIKVNDIPLAGTHNVLNVMAALGICMQVGVKPTDAISHLATFKSAPHRCVEIANYGGVRFIDDSKATNIGATIAALEGLAPHTKGKLILIAGGDAKGADMNSLAPYLSQHVACVFAIGKDASLFKACFPNTTLVTSMAEAVKGASSFAGNGDVVLLSPACASIDMFNNYMHRGEVFKQAVEALFVDEVTS
ncbi:MAG: UDP-N-acetylmuramoylalanine--D-glutamate ligase [Alteromonas sp. Nap_26]|nr:MAG: UDP-N-acetylmuramoylalanine--D-glutamate ligase [Alteromonas sp. Nap_26]